MAVENFKPAPLKPVDDLSAALLGARTPVSTRAEGAFRFATTYCRVVRSVRTVRPRSQHQAE
jgi:hypothetical protein